MGKDKNELVGNFEIFKTFSNYQGLESFLKYSNHKKERIHTKVMKISKKIHKQKYKKCDYL